MGYSTEELQKLQSEDPNISTILKEKLEGKYPSSSEMCSASPEARHYWNYWKSLIVRDGLLFKVNHKHDGTFSFMQFIVPKAIRDTVLTQMHNSILSGHLGRKKTVEKILQRYYWFQLREHVYRWIQRCDICAKNRLPTKKTRAPLGSMTVGATMDRWSTDIVGPLPETPRGNRYILVVTDAFSKWTEAFGIPDQTAKTTASCILREMICRYGCPLDIHSDQGRNYESNIFRNLCKLLGIRKTRSSARHPQGNGQVERFNRTLIKMIRAYIEEDQTDWDLYLHCLTAAYRATSHESTNFTPNMLMLGREVRLPGEIITQQSVPSNEDTKYGDYVDNIKEHLENAHIIAQKHLQTNAKRHKELYDAKADLQSFNKGDFVWYLAEIRKEGVNPKLQSPYIGPCVIINKMNNLDYSIQIDKKGTKRLVHHNKIKPYIGNDVPKWAKAVKAKLNDV